MPDELCLPAWSGVRMTLLPQGDGSMRNAFVSKRQGEQLVQPIHLRWSRSYDIIAGCNDLIHFLCHLTC